MIMTLTFTAQCALKCCSWTWSLDKVNYNLNNINMMVIFQQIVIIIYFFLKYFMVKLNSNIIQCSPIIICKSNNDFSKNGS